MVALCFFIIFFYYLCPSPSTVTCWGCSCWRRCRPRRRRRSGRPGSRGGGCGPRGYPGPVPGGWQPGVAWLGLWKSRQLCGLLFWRNLDPKSFLKPEPEGSWIWSVKSSGKWSMKCSWTRTLKSYRAWSQYGLGTWSTLINVLFAKPFSQPIKAFTYLTLPYRKMIGLPRFFSKKIL